MNNLNKHTTKYAAPGYGEINMNIYSYLISLLSFEYEQNTLTLTNYIENNTFSSMGEADPYIQNFRNRHTRDIQTTYSSHRNERKGNIHVKPLAVMDYDQPNEISEVNQNPERVNIEKRIYVDSLKRYLSNRFERERGSAKNQGIPTDLASYFNPKSRFSTHMPNISKNRMGESGNVNRQRRTTIPSKHRLIHVNNDKYYTSQNQRKKFPTTLNSKTESYRSGPLCHRRKLSRKHKNDKVSYSNFNNVGNHSMGKPLQADAHYTYSTEQLRNDNEKSDPNIHNQDIIRHPYTDDQDEPEPQKTLKSSKEVNNQYNKSLSNPMEDRKKNI